MTESTGKALQRTAFAAKTQLFASSEWRLFQQLLTSQYAPPQKLQELQDARMAALVAFAAQASPFYRDLYAEHGLDTARPFDQQRLGDLPLVDRTMLREGARQVPTSEYAPSTVEERLTGGSTGEPIKTASDVRFAYRTLVWRMYSWWGVWPHENMAHLGVWKPSRRQKAAYDLRWWPTRHIWAHPGLMDAEMQMSFIAAMQRIKPALLEGYVGAVSELADFVAQGGHRIDSLRAIGVTAAPLTPATRRHIEHSLNAPVFDHYRSGEVPFLAAECSSQDGMHVFAEHRRIEIVDEAGHPVPPGVEGEVVVTDLSNRVFPIIRYRLGDRSWLLPEPCRCGVTLPRMAPPVGRLNTVIYLPDGSAMAAGIAGLFVAIPDAVRQFQMHQRADYSLLVRVVLGSATDARQQTERVADVIRQKAAGRIRVDVDYVDQIPHERGKIRFFTNDIPARR